MGLPRDMMCIRFTKLTLSNMSLLVKRFAKLKNLDRFWLTVPYRFQKVKIDFPEALITLERFRPGL